MRVGIGEIIAVEMESGNSRPQNTIPVKLPDIEIICWRFSSQDSIEKFGHRHTSGPRLLTEPIIVWIVQAN